MAKKAKSDLDSTGMKLGETLEFLRLIWALDHSLQSRSKQMQAVIGLTGPQRLVLRVVGKFPGISAGALARTLHLHPSTLTGVLARLEGKRLLERRSDPSDGRKAVLELTAEGRRLEVPVRGTIENEVREILREIPSPKIEATRLVLARLAESLDAGPAGAGERRTSTTRKKRR